MTNQTPRFNQLLLVLLVVLYLISLGLFSYANWKADGDFVLWMFLVNALIVSIPLVLLFGAVYVLITAWREHRSTGHVTPRLAKIIHLAPRIAAILIIFFITLFSLDVFDIDASPLELLGAFLMHSLPSIFLILVLVLAWRRPAIGFVAFLLAGLIFLRFVIFNLNVGHFLLFSGPMLLISALFYADWRLVKPQPPGPLEAVN